MKNSINKNVEQSFKKSVYRMLWVYREWVENFVINLVLFSG